MHFFPNLNLLYLKFLYVQSHYKILEFKNETKDIFSWSPKVETVLHTPLFII